MIELLVRCPVCKKQRKWRKETASSTPELENSKFWCFPCGKIHPIKNNIVKVISIVRISGKNVNKW